VPNPSHFNDDFLDIAELAAWLHISVRHVRRLVAENRIPNHKIGGLVRLRRSEILEWLAANGRGAATQQHDDQPA
jgi:excisionase family DNA binding protein